MHEILKCNGSLLNNKGFILSAYDLSKNKTIKDVTPLKLPKIYNASHCPFSIDYSEIESLTIINGMGVTLGDSIVGISVLDVIKKINKKIKIKVIRPESAPLYVEEIYNLASDIIDDICYMPLDILFINASGVTIDIGNQLYWPDFHVLEMHDFFIKGLGLIVPDELNYCLSNTWLNNLDIKKIPLKDYVLFSPVASTPIRSIPQRFHYDIVDMLYKKYGLSVVGFTDIKHPHYINVSNYSSKTIDFISIISNAYHIYTCDSSALHISAGFNVPTTCIFNTISPELRTKYYQDFSSFFIGNERLFKIQNSQDTELLNLVDEQFQLHFYK